MSRQSVPNTVEEPGGKSPSGHDAPGGKSPSGRGAPGGRPSVGSTRRRKTRGRQGFILVSSASVLLAIMVLTGSPARFSLASSSTQGATSTQGASPQGSSASGGEGNGSIYVVAQVPGGPGCPVSQCPGGSAPGSSSSQSTNGPTYTWSCKWQPVASTPGNQSKPAGQKTGAWYVQTCMRSSTACQSTYDICGLTHQVVWVQHPGSQTPPQPSAGSLAEQARSAANLPSPTIHTAPDHIGPDPGTAVNLKTWLWVGRSIWHPVSTSASAGKLTATVTAVPVSVTWDTGDGHALVCNGPGTPWNPQTPAWSQQTSCYHVWKESSLGEPNDGPGGAPAYRLSATINWAVSWSASDGRGGSLPTMHTTSVVYLPVMQIESVN
jgi:hypothetical protein